MARPFHLQLMARPDLLAMTDQTPNRAESFDASSAFTHATRVIRKAPERALMIILWEYGLYAGLNLAVVLAFPILVHVQVGGPATMTPSSMQTIMMAQGILMLGSLLVMFLVEPAWQRLYVRGETQGRALFRIGPDEGRYGIALLTQLGVIAGVLAAAGLGAGLVYGAMMLTQAGGPILSVIVPTLVAVLVVPPALAVLLFGICLNLPMFAGMVARNDFNPVDHAGAVLKNFMSIGRIAGYFILTCVATVVAVGLITAPFRLLFMLFSGDEPNRVIIALSMLLMSISALLYHFVIANLSRGIGAFFALHFAGKANPLLEENADGAAAAPAAPTVTPSDG